MKHEDVIAQKIAFLNGTSTDDISQTMKNEISNDQQLNSEIEFIEQLWNNPLEKSDEMPSPQMRANFYQMLSHAQSVQSNHSNSRQSLNISHWFNLRSLSQVFLLVVCFSAGWFINNLPIDQSNVNARLADRIDDLNKVIAMSMLKNDSATERLAGVDYAGSENLDNHLVTETLIELLNNDRSSVVRLSVVNALSKRSNLVYLQNDIVESLSLQKNALVQLALFELLQNSPPLSEKQISNILSNEQLDKEINRLLERKNHLKRNQST